MSQTPNLNSKNKENQSLGRLALGIKFALTIFMNSLLMGSFIRSELFCIHILCLYFLAKGNFQKKLLEKNW